MNSASEIEAMISSLDIRLFQMNGQTDKREKKALLAIQRVVRLVKGSYVYLEIGSLLGASMQPHLLDPRCERIYSIDKRPSVVPDERGRDVHYSRNSTERMLNCLRRVSEKGLDRIVCFEDDASNVDKREIIPKPNMCFIDGEHTDRAVVSDFRFCRSALSDNGVVVFHDSHLLCNGLSKIVGDLKKNGERFRAYNLPTHLFVIELEECSIHKDESIREMLANNYIGYLKGLKSLLPYRKFAVSKGFPLVRS